MGRKNLGSKTKNDVWKKTGGKCFYCGRQTIPFGSFGMSFCIDHLWPVARGGGDNIENLVPCCHRCNLSKSDINLTEFLWEKHATTPYFKDAGLDWSEAKKDPAYMTDSEYLRR